MEDVTLKRLFQEGVPVNRGLPGIVLKQVRSGRAVATRINILGVFLAIANDSKSLVFFKSLLRDQNMMSFLSGSEKDILDKEYLSNQEEIDLSWYQESLYALSWCLGIVPKMGSAKGEASIDSIFRYLPPEVELEEFIRTAKLIDEKLIVEELEYYYRLHWAVRHPESWGVFNRLKCKSYKISVIRERRRALEWVVDNNLEWDDISLDT